MTNERKIGMHRLNPTHKVHNEVFMGFFSPTENYYNVLLQDERCENILHGFLYVFDLAFVILKGIYGFEFPKRFLEISSRDLTSLLLQLI